jgi:hypothetical protein
VGTTVFREVSTKNMISRVNLKDLSYTSGLNTTIPQTKPERCRESLFYGEVPQKSMDTRVRYVNAFSNDTLAI